MLPTGIAVGHGRIPGEAAATKPSGKRSKSVTGSIIELVAIVAVALGLALGVQALDHQAYKIPTGSMEPTLIEGQRVLVNRLDMDFSKPHVGGIYVFHPPEGAKREECGVVKSSAVQRARSQCPGSRAKTSSSGLSPAPETKSTSPKGTSSARPPVRAGSLRRRTPTSNPAASARSATSARRSGFQPATGS